MVELRGAGLPVDHGVHGLQVARVGDQRQVDAEKSRKNQKRTRREPKENQTTQVGGGSIKNNTTATNRESDRKL